MSNGKQGPEEVCGRFSSREELEKYVSRMNAVGGYTRRQLAEDAEVSIGTVQFILKQSVNSPDPEFVKLKNRLLRIPRWTDFRREAP